MNKFELFVKKYSPEILMSMGIAGMAFSTAWGINATIKATRKIDSIKAKENKTKLTAKEVFKETWKFYIPSALSIIISVPCIIAGNRVSSKRNAALAAAYTLSEAALHEYQSQTKKLVGEVKAKEIDNAVAEESVKKVQPTKEIIMSDGKQLFFEPMTGRYFESTWNDIVQAVNSLNESALASSTGIYYLNDFLERLGLDGTEAGDILGWSTPTFGNSKGLLKISMDSAITKDNKPCGCIHYDVRPYYVVE